MTVDQNVCVDRERLRPFPLARPYDHSSRSASKRLYGGSRLAMFTLGGSILKSKAEIRKAEFESWCRSLFEFRFSSYH
jgi:hypothetical protein